MARKRSRPRKRESPFAILELVEELVNFERFLKTRRVVQSGQPVHEFSNEELQSRGLLGPWSTNFYESALAAAPSLILLWFANLLTKPVPLNESARIASEIEQLFNPFVFPLTMMLLSWVASRVSFYRADLTPEKRENARYAYLYLDGTYGL
ncbi:MAG: hypothetical protein AAFU71_12060, partial [Cyanobacteria bacterium J06632_22]